MHRSRLILVGFLLFWSTKLIAEDPVPKELQKLVEESALKYAEAFAKENSRELAGLFTLEAEYVDASGTIFHGRKAIEAEYAASFSANPEGTIEIELLSIRPIAKGVIVEDGISTFVPKESGTRSQTRYSATHVKQADGTWLIASVRELEPARITARDRLQELAWLVGSWREEVGGTVTTTTWKWSENGNFLIGEFTIRTPGESTLQGTHRIGWDAERKQFRSWIFVSTGGSAGGWWGSNHDGSWSTNLTGIDADGLRTSSRLTYATDGNDAIVVSQEQVMRNGIRQPGQTHRIVRQPPMPAANARK